MPTKSKRYSKSLGPIHTHGFSDSGSYLKEVRARLRIGKFRAGIEWHRRWKQALHLKVVLGGEDNDIGFHCCLPLIGWLSFSFAILPFKLNQYLDSHMMGRHTGFSITRDWIELEFHKRSFAGWTKGKRWNEGWDYHFYYNRPLDWFFGRITFTEPAQLSHDTVQIALPDGPYILDIKKMERFRYRPRLYKNGKYDTWFEITPSRPAPVPGKGTQSYNCGEDAYYSFNSGGDNVEDAVAHFVKSVLRTRRRYGGNVNWQPSPKVVDRAI